MKSQIHSSRLSRSPSRSHSPHNAVSKRQKHIRTIPSRSISNSTTTASSSTKSPHNSSSIHVLTGIPDDYSSQSSYKAIHALTTQYHARWMREKSISKFPNSLQLRPYVNDRNHVIFSLPTTEDESYTLLSQTIIYHDAYSIDTDQSVSHSALTVPQQYPCDYPTTIISKQFSLPLHITPSSFPYYQSRALSSLSLPQYDMLDTNNTNNNNNNTNDSSTTTSSTSQQPQSLRTSTAYDSITFGCHFLSQIDAHDAGRLRFDKGSKYTLTITVPLSYHKLLLSIYDLNNNNNTTITTTASSNNNNDDVGPLTRDDIYKITSLLQYNTNTDTYTTISHDKSDIDYSNNITHVQYTLSEWIDDYEFTSQQHPDIVSHHKRRIQMFPYIIKAWQFYNDHNNDTSMQSSSASTSKSSSSPNIAASSSILSTHITPYQLLWYTLYAATTPSNMYFFQLFHECLPSHMSEDDFNLQVSTLKY